MISTIHTPTPNLQSSIKFYEQLGFARIEHNDLVLFSDGKFIIEINENRSARGGIKFYNDAWASVVDELSQITKVTQTPRGYLLGDGSGCAIYLEEKHLNVELPKTEASALGNFMGLTLECLDINHSIEIWKRLGFNQTMGKIEQGWVVYTHPSGVGVSLMAPNACPHLFFNPSLSFFNGKNNLSIIQKIRDLGIEITEEITHFNKEGIVDNIIIRDPGGYGFFIFSD